MDFIQKSIFLLSLFVTEIMSEKIVFRYLWKKTIIFRPKNWSFKKGQKMAFFKEVSSWILSKTRTFAYRSFSQKLCQKRSFLDILNRTQKFENQKIKFKQGQKMDIF